MRGRGEVGVSANLLVVWGVRSDMVWIGFVGRSWLEAVGGWRLELEGSLKEAVGRPVSLVGLAPRFLCRFVSVVGTYLMTFL